MDTAKKIAFKGGRDGYRPSARTRSKSYSNRALIKRSRRVADRFALREGLAQ